MVSSGRSAANYRIAKMRFSVPASGLMDKDQEKARYLFPVDLHKFLPSSDGELAMKLQKNIGNISNGDDTVISLAS